MPKNLPKTDSIQKLAEFWDTHDLTDFEDQLQQVAKPVFVRKPTIKIALDATELKVVDQLAQAKGVTRETLVRTWVQQHLTRGKKKRPTKRAS
jgi:predicted DNA binding CopG/RHH family protein